MTGIFSDPTTRVPLSGPTGGPKAGGTEPRVPVHALVNAGLAALLLLIGVIGALSLNAARHDTSRAGLTPKQANDRVVFCHLDSCDLA